MHGGIDNAKHSAIRKTLIVLEIFGSTDTHMLVLTLETIVSHGFTNCEFPHADRL